MPSPARYRSYDNFDGIDVPNTADIPCDYPGMMGVPITFLDKFNPEQFELVGSSLEVARPIREIAPKGTYSAGGPCFYIEQPNGQFRYKRLFDRLVIRNKHPQEGL